MKNFQRFNARLITLLLALSLGGIVYETWRVSASTMSANADAVRRANSSGPGRLRQTNGSAWTREAGLAAQASCDLSCPPSGSGTLTKIEWAGGLIRATGNAFLTGTPKFVFRLGYIPESADPPVAIGPSGGDARSRYRISFASASSCNQYSGVTITNFQDTFLTSGQLLIDIVVDNFVNRRVLEIEYFYFDSLHTHRILYANRLVEFYLPGTPGLPTASDLDPTKWGLLNYSLEFSSPGTALEGIPTDAKGVFSSGTCSAGADSTPPVISCPANVIGMLDPQQCGAAVDPGTATATDNATTSPIITGTRSDGLPLTAPYPKGVTTITWRATDEANNSATCMQTVTINCPTITVPSIIGSGGVGVFYDQTLSATPSGNYSYSVSGILPPGLSLNPTTGRLSGTPTQSGEYGFTVTAAACDCSGSRTYNITVNCSNITISPASLANGSVGVSYSATVSATPSSSYAFGVINGALPPGLSLNSSTGAISGTPTQTGTFTFRITAIGSGSCLGFRDYQISVLGCAAINVVPASLSNGTAGAAYSRTVHATPAAAYSFTVTSGALPPGLTLNSSTGAIGGTPTQTGTFGFRITASNNSCGGYRDYTITVGCNTITLPGSLTGAIVGANYSQSVAASPVGNYSYSLVAGSLPVGLTLNQMTGLLTGTPTSTGSYGFTVKAQTANGCIAQKAYTLTVTCPSIVVTPESLPVGSVGTAYSATFSATPTASYTYAVTAGALPAGLALNASTGVLSGTPTTSGSFAFTITASSAGSSGACTGSRPYTMVVNSSGGSCPSITLSALSNGALGQLYTSSIAASPSGSYTYTLTAGNFPPGLTLYSAFGLIYGYPTTKGTFNFTLTATDVGNCTGSRSYNVVIN